MLRPLALALTLAPGLALADAHTMPERAIAEVASRDGDPIGTVTLNATPSGFVAMVIALTEIPEGTHGVHLHEVGDCSADDFTSAGGHMGEDESAHGVLNADGPHAGDLPNAVVHADGAMNVEYFSDLFDMERIFDEDGTAFIVHAGPDDYVTQPAGDAGARIACGVFMPAADVQEP